MKRILFSILVFVCAMGVKAQDMMVATLQSGEVSKVFYGADSFVEAYNAAQTGDLITLSPGTFNVTTISKSLKIQGTGYMDDPGKELYRTVLNATLYVESSIEGLLLEGVYLGDGIALNKSASVKNFVLKRCCFKRAEFQNGKTEDCQIEHCRIERLYIGDNAKEFSVVNSVVSNIYPNKENSTIFFTNTIIHKIDPGAIATFKNCILDSEYSFFKLHKNCTVSHCLYLVDGMLSNISSPTSCRKSTEDEIWGGEKNFSETDSYDLTEEAKNEYKGEDGTEVGIHGGAKPFTSTPSHPQITARDIATKTSGGKLKVNIIVEVGDE